MLIEDFSIISKRAGLSDVQSVVSALFTTGCNRDILTHTLRRLSPMPILRVTAHVNGVYIDRPEAVKSSHCALPSPWSLSASRRYQLVIKKMPKPSQIPSKTSSECNRSIKKPLAKRSIQSCVLPSG